MKDENLNGNSDCMFTGMEEVAPNSWVRKDSPWAGMMTKVFQLADELDRESKQGAAA